MTNHPTGNRWDPRPPNHTSHTFRKTSDSGDAVHRSDGNVPRTGTEPPPKKPKLDIQPDAAALTLAAKELGGREAGEHVVQTRQATAETPSDAGKTIRQKLLLFPPRSTRNRQQSKYNPDHILSVKKMAGPGEVQVKPFAAVSPSSAPQYQPKGKAKRSPETAKQRKLFYGSC